MHLPVAVIGKMIEMARQRGGEPAEIHMSKATFDVIENSKIAAPDTRSPLQRMMGAKTPDPLFAKSFFNVPVVMNERFGLGVIAIREQTAMGRDDWYEEILKDQGGHVPWLERTPAPLGTVTPQEAQEDAPVSLSDLSASKGEASASDCLMKAFTDIDKVEEVIVIRCMKSGNLEMTGNSSRTAMMGALQLAMSYLIQQ